VTEIQIAPEVRQAAPDLVLGCVEVDVRAAPADAILDAVLDEAAREASARGLEPAACPPIAALRALYKRLGKDPSRYRGSPEALLRRATSGKPLYRILNVVDVINVVSLATLLPIGLYDAAHVRPPVVLRRAGEGESYAGIGREALNLAGLPVLADAEGPFGSPTSDSERTKVTAGTRRVLAVIFGVTGRAELEQAVAMLAQLLRFHAGAGDPEVEFVA
jgi:DNA/RNA-binding domain of Phe-tRNA-synthetase-like protein